MIEIFFFEENPLANVKAEKHISAYMHTHSDKKTCILLIKMPPSAVIQKLLDISLNV